MIEYFLIGVAVLIYVAVPTVKFGSRRHREQIARNDSRTIGADPGSSVWTVSDCSSAASDAGSCGSSDSSSGSGCSSGSSD